MVYLFISTALVIGLIWFNFPTIKSRVLNAKQQAGILIRIVKQMQNQERQTSTETFEVDPSDVTASIRYNRMGTSYKVVVPFSRLNVASMSQLKATLLYSNQPPLDITQQPGIPYSFSAKDLGGLCIRIENAETGVSHDYTDKPPLYATETACEE